MERDPSPRYSPQQDNLLFAKELNNLILELFNFYRSHHFFFIPNDLIEAVASLLGYYVADSYLFDSVDFQQGMATIKDNISRNAEKGFGLAGLYKECQENIRFELKQRQIYPQQELHIVSLILEINHQLGELLLTSNKTSTIQQPSPEIEYQVNHFVRQQLYPRLQNALDQQEALKDKNAFIITGLSTYLGWLSGFYANLLESTAALFASYTVICIETAANQKSKH